MKKLTASLLAAALLALPVPAFADDSGTFITVGATLTGAAAFAATTSVVELAQPDACRYTGCGAPALGLGVSSAVGAAGVYLLVHGLNLKHVKAAPGGVAIAF